MLEKSFDFKRFSTFKHLLTSMVLKFIKKCKDIKDSENIFKEAATGGVL